MRRAAAPVAGGLVREGKRGQALLVPAVAKWARGGRGRGDWVTAEGAAAVAAAAAAAVAK